MPKNCERLALSAIAVRDFGAYFAHKTPLVVRPFFGKSSKINALRIRPLWG